MWCLVHIQSMLEVKGQEALQSDLRLSGSNVSSVLSTPSIQAFFEEPITITPVGTENFSRKYLGLSETFNPRINQRLWCLIASPLDLIWQLIKMVTQWLVGQSNDKLMDSLISMQHPVIKWSLPNPSLEVGIRCIFYALCQVRELLGLEHHP